MSNSTKQSFGMTDKQIYKHIPQLRFSEFADSGEWEVKRLGDIFERITQKNREGNKNVLTISAQYGLVSQFDYFNKNVASSDVSNYFLIKKGDFAYNKSRSQGYPYGAIKPLLMYDKGIVSPLYLCFRMKENAGDTDFFRHYFETDALSNEIAKIAQEGARNHGLLNISTEDFFNIQLRVPPVEEQQRIARSLSTLDNLIKASNEKLELLKAHKKGLMQQLLAPINGGGNYCVPRLRFPEFNNTKEWEIKKLGEIATTFSGGTPSISRKQYYGGDIPFIRSGEIKGTKTELSLTQLGVDNSSAKLVCAGTILYALYGATSGEVAISKISGAINQAILAIIVNNEFCEAQYLYHILLANKEKILNKYLQGGQGNLSGSIISNLQILLPPIEEQRKIADCLSSIDEQVESYDNKRFQLQHHKRALMQQLFPQA